MAAKSSPSRRNTETFTTSAKLAPVPSSRPSPNQWAFDRIQTALGDYYSSPVAADGKIFLANQEGKVSVVTAGKGLGSAAGERFGGGVLCDSGDCGWRYMYVRRVGICTGFNGCKEVSIPYVPRLEWQAV